MSNNANAADLVFEFILKKINQGVWKPNTKIWTEPVLCSELGVSRMAVREAIQKLSTLSVLRKVQGSGTYVENVDLSGVINTIIPILNISDEELLSIMEFRKYFECGNVRMFIDNADQDDLNLLDENIKDMFANKDNLEAFYIADYDFHHNIAKGTKNVFIIRISDLLSDILKKQHRGTSYRVGPDIGLEYHSTIFKYIKQKDAEMACLFMQRHIEAMIDGLKGYVEHTKAIKNNYKKDGGYIYEADKNTSE